MSKFQAILLGICVVLAVGGLVAFSVFKGKGGTQEISLTMWGTIDKDLMGSYLDDVMKQSGSNITIKYSQANPATFYTSYIEALASGRGPDLLLLPQSQYLQFASKTYQIPYSSMSQATFNQTYLPISQIYLGSQGIAAIPFSIDPMVMYWNKDIFINALITQPPAYWSDITTLAPKLTVKDTAFNITTSAVALGEYTNIDHAKEILSLLFMDVGSPIVQRTADGLQTSLSSGYSTSVNPQSALTFYTQFANPTQDTYSWSKSLPTSKSLFLANKLGIYFGFASEYSELQNKNPNLNFDVAMVPQMNIRVNNQPLHQTYGRLYGVSIARSSQNTTAALQAALIMSSQTGSQLWSSYSHLPSVRIDSLSAPSNNAVQTIFARSALWSRTWSDPSYTKTDAIFKTLVQSVTSGASTVQDALSQASGDLDLVVRSQ